jgi:hypothetical protein
MDYILCDDNIDFDNIDLDNVNYPEELSNLSKLEELDNLKMLKKVKISDKLKCLFELQDNRNLYLSRENGIVKKLMLMYYNDYKYKLLCDNQMYNPTNLLPTHTISYDFDLYNSVSRKKYPGVGEFVEIKINKGYNKNFEFINGLGLEITFHDLFVDFDNENFKPSDIFGQIDLMIANTKIELTKSWVIDFIFGKNKLNWIYESNKLIIGIPLELIGSKSNGIFANKIKLKHDIEIKIHLANTNYTSNVKQINCFLKCSDYVNYEKQSHKKLPVGYNLDLFNYISTEPIINSYEIASLNNIFASNYNYYQYEDIIDVTNNGDVRVKTNFNGYVKGICFAFFDSNGNRFKYDDIYFSRFRTQINGHDNIDLSKQSILYKMKDLYWLNASNSTNGFYYIDFGNFLNFDYIDYYCFVVKDIKLKNEVINATNKIYLNTFGLSSNTLVYLEGNIVKTI